MSRSPKTTIEQQDLLALLDDDEKAALVRRLRIDQNGDRTMSDFSIRHMLGEIIAIRRPFIEMMSEIADLLRRIELPIRGNIRFVVLPGMEAELKINFGEQLRETIATALDWGDSEKVSSLKASTEKAARIISDLCGRMRPTLVNRHSDIGRLLKQRSEMLPRTWESVRDSMLADRLTHPVREYNAADRQGMQMVEARLDRVHQLCQRLAKGSRGEAQVADAVVATVSRCHVEVQKGARAGPVSMEYPHAARSVESSRFDTTIRTIDALEEELLAVANYEQAVDSVYDYLGLELWRQRWRVYELWVFAHAMLVLLRLPGMKVGETRISVDGEWDLRFSRDDRPVLTVGFKGELFEFYYQYYQARENVGDMPDIALKLRGGPFIAVIDPKHGESYARSALNEVCLRYSMAFNPHLSCVVNYFDVRNSECLETTNDARILYGVRPATASADVLDERLLSALTEILVARGLELPGSRSIVVLFDGSSSTERCRVNLLESLKRLINPLQRQLASDSLALIFGDRILNEGSISDLLSSCVLKSIPSSGTNVAAAIRAGLDRLACLSEPRELWLLTDGTDTAGVLELSDQLMNAHVDLVVVVNKSAANSDLRTLTRLVGGQYISA